jgi:exoribonuclease R
VCFVSEEVVMANPSGDEQIASVAINRSRYDPVSSDFLRKLFRQFLVKIGCSQCLELAVPSSTTDRQVHCCARNRLLIKRIKTDGAPWQIVRCDITVDYLNDVRQCEGACVGAEACTRAHNEGELVVWKEARAMGVSLERFFADVATSRLYPEVALQYWTRDRGVEVALLCRRCVQLGQGDSATKAKHKPFCKGHHDWSLAAACFTLAGTDGQAGRYFADDEIPPDSHSDALQFSVFINEIKKFGLSDRDVVSTVIKIKQQAEKKVKREEARQAISEAEADVSVGVLENDDLEVGDSLFSPPDEHDDDGSDSEDDSEEVDPDDLYYDNMLPLSEALRKRDSQPDVFKRCRIKWNGIYDATATPIDEDIQPIKLRGRMNCGPCFNGDEVIVEIKHVQKLDSDSHTADPRLANANSSSDAVERFNKDTHVRHGKVVAIVKKIQRRNGSVFVCTVDEYQSNLVKPLCATVPKIHLFDAVVRQKFGREAKDGYVALYKLGEFGNLQAKKIVQLNEKDRQDKLFVVNVLKWSRRHLYPLGFAMKYLPEGTDAVSSERVARCACHVPPSYSPGDLRLLHPSFGLGLDTWRQGREDMRQKLVVSIDPPDCRDVDDAVSVHFDGRYYEVGVHIADVSCLVDKGGRLDTEALQRGVTFYPKTGDKPVHMFPTEFAENYCSLLPNRDRPCISVTFAVDKDDGKIVRSSIVRSIIHNKHKFTYDQVQAIIFSHHQSSAAGNEEISDETRTTLQQLHVAAKALRRARLGASRHYVQFEELLSTAGCKGSFAAHFLVEEFMIVANRLVAEKLVGAFPDCIPLRKQGRPDCEEFEEWFASHSHSLHISSFFQQYVPVLQEIVPNVHSVPSSKLTSVPLLKEVAELLQGAVEQGDVEKVREILGAEDYHPLHATALDAWRSIQRSAEYVCSGDTGDRQHFSLGCNLYTHFTSPIRRYIDIVVHRLLLAALRGSKSCPYSPAEISAICEKVNRASAYAKKYDKFSTTVAAAESLRAVAAFKPSILVSIDENSLCFNFPGTPVLKRSQRSITFGNLDVCDKPYHPTIPSKDSSRADKQDLEKMIFKWSRRIYDVNHLSQVGRLKSEARRSDALLRLLRDIHVRRVSLDDWKQVREAMDGESDSALLEHVGNMLQSVVWNPDCREVTSEVKDSRIVNHHVRFDMELQRTTVMQVQLAADSVNGILQPVITRLSLTPQHSICVQHMDDAIKCFADVATDALKEQYTSLEEYQKIWRPIIAMEAAYAAVQDADPVTIRNVPVCLQQTSPNSNKYCGHITLDIGFCKERCINLLRNSKDAEEDMHDYLCLKFSWSPANCTQHMDNLTASHTWTCHALAVHGAVAGENDSESGSTKDERTSGLFTVHFDVHHFSTPPPTQLLDTPGAKCTVELLAKPLPHRYEAYCIKHCILYCL